ncbi:hypothetical protein AAG570_013983, partial [Ranatra chinensis]
ECGKSYKLRTSLRNHKRYYCGKEPQFKCPYCEQRSHQKGHIKQHIAFKHGIFLDPWENSGDEDSEKNENLMMMMSTSSGDLQSLDGKQRSKGATRRAHGHFTCEQCSRTYIRKDSLQRHTLWECGKEPKFQCPFCPQKCKRKSHHLRHIQRQHKDMLDLIMRNHQKWECGKEPQFQCPYCNYRAKQKMHVARHIERMHKFLSGFHRLDLDKIHSCPTCGRLYKWKHSLKMHIKFECGKEPQFKCSFCNYRSKIKSNLKRHLYIRHNGYVLPDGSTLKHINS